MKRAEILALHGVPSRTREAKIGPSGLPGRTDTFAAPGGKLIVTTLADRVVGLSTYSPFYATSSGLGVGVRMEVRPPWVRSGGGCANTVRRRLGSAVVSIRTRRDGQIVALSMVRGDLATNCS